MSQVTASPSWGAQPGALPSEPLPEPKSRLDRLGRSESVARPLGPQLSRLEHGAMETQQRGDREPRCGARGAGCRSRRHLGPARLPRPSGCLDPV